MPRLFLGKDTLVIAQGGRRYEEVTVAVMRVEFDYGGSKVRCTDTSPRIYDLGRIKAGPISRDAFGESQAKRMLESLGAMELDALDDCTLEHATDFDYVVRLDGDVHALCAFSAYALPQLRKLGWSVDIAPDYPWQVLETSAPLYADVQPDQKRPDWFGLELGVEVDGHRVNLMPALLEMLDRADSLEDLLKRARRCIAVPVSDTHYLAVPPERLRLLLKVMVEMYRDGTTGLSFRAMQAPAIADLCDAFAARGGELRVRAPHGFSVASAKLEAGPDKMVMPRGLHATLRPYQEEGIAWLQHMRANGAGAVLADDMGLGKTLQTIAHVLAERESGRMVAPCLVVTLTSLVGNWAREFKKFAPSLRVLQLRGATRKQHFDDIDTYDVVISTYPLLSRDKEALGKLEYHLLVLDEAHTIKNANAIAHEAARAIRAKHKVSLSGTPIENNLGELWSMMDFLNPGILGTSEQFRANFRTPIEQMGETTRLLALRDRVRPYILRRTKDAVARDLPPKTDIVRAVELTGAQRELYESIRVSAHADVRREIKRRGLGGATIAILDALLKLRQVCCDPRLVHVDAARKVKESAKSDMFFDLLTQQLGQGRRILVFSQFAKMLSLISEGLLGRGIGHVTLTGATQDRDKPINAFEQGRADVFLISLKAGGTGLNLTSADTVIHYDPWWNPAAQAQATDRAYRIGQTKPVFAYNLIAAGSVEERMLALQGFKRRLAESIIGGPPGESGPLFSERDVDDLLSPLE
ncbi:MAG: DEAD/DEAH box helicase [Myxococcales bacterium]|nr:DEAD/DEAH box helicase [Myxococcales bacterium]